MPFVQGQLRKGEELTFDIRTQCAHSGRSIHFEMDGQLNYRLVDTEARPLMFAPDVDWDQFEEPNIIHAF
jgi:hypothetical protein